MKVILEETNRITLYNHTGITKFAGCQCFKDCTCNEDFKQVPYNYYTVKKKFNKPRTTSHNSLEEARIRIEYLNTIPITNNKKYR